MSGCMAFDCAQESLPGHHYCAGHVAPSIFAYLAATPKDPR